MSDFRTAAGRLFGAQASARMARALGVGQRAVQRWLASAADVPADVLDFVIDQEGRLERSQLRARLEAALAEAAREGVHPEIVAAQLAELQEAARSSPGA